MGYDWAEPQLPMRSTAISTASGAITSRRFGFTSAKASPARGAEQKSSISRWPSEGLSFVPRNRYYRNINIATERERGQHYENQELKKGGKKWANPPVQSLH